MVTTFPFGATTVNVTSVLTLSVIPVISIMSEPISASALISSPLSLMSGYEYARIIPVSKVDSVTEVLLATIPFITSTSTLKVYNEFCTADCIAVIV